jgi:hypothetical protein
MYNLKTLMVSAGWVVKASGDGTSYFSASDGITTGASGAGGLGNSGAWFRIQDGAGLRELVFQRGSTGNQYWWIKYSASAKFTGGSPAAGTTPTATDGQNVFGSSSSGTQLFTGAESSMRFHCMAENAAPYTWYILAYSTGGSTTKGLLMMDSLQSGSYLSSSGDDDPVIFGVSTTGTDLYNAGATTLWTQSSNATPGSAAGVWGWIKHGLAGSGWVNLAFPRVLDAAICLLPGGLGSNPYNGNDEVFTPYVARQSGATAPVGWKGVPRLTRWIGTQRALSADTLTVSTSNDYIVVEKCWALPFNGSTPLN